MQTSAAKGDEWISPSLGWRPGRGVPAATVGRRRWSGTPHCVFAATAFAANTAWMSAAAAGESVSPLPILLWITAPLLLAAASAIAAYAVNIASRRLRRVLISMVGSLHRRLVDGETGRPLPPGGGAPLRGTGPE